MNLNIIKQSEVKILWYSKNINLIIFQSPFQVKLFREYNDDIFVDGTFFIALNLVIKYLLQELMLKN